MTGATSYGELAWSSPEDAFGAASERETSSLMATNNTIRDESDDEPCCVRALLRLHNNTAGQQISLPDIARELMPVLGQLPSVVQVV